MINFSFSFLFMLAIPTYYLSIYLPIFLSIDRLTPRNTEYITLVTIFIFFIIFIFLFFFRFTYIRTVLSLAR